MCNEMIYGEFRRKRDVPVDRNDALHVVDNAECLDDSGHDSDHKKTHLQAYDFRALFTFCHAPK